jgi:hypothetical protein
MNSYHKSAKESLFFEEIQTYHGNCKGGFYYDINDAREYLIKLKERIKETRKNLKRDKLIIVVNRKKIKHARFKEVMNKAPYVKGRIINHELANEYKKLLSDLLSSHNKVRNNNLNDNVEEYKKEKKIYTINIKHYEKYNEYLECRQIKNRLIREGCARRSITSLYVKTLYSHLILKRTIQNNQN